MAKKARREGSDRRELVLLPLAKILPADVNPKGHEIPAIVASLRRFGYVEPVVLDTRTEKLVAGHGRIESLGVLKSGGEPAPLGIEVREDDWYVPTIVGWESGTDADALGYLLASNRTSELGGWIERGLAEALTDLSRMAALEGTGYTDKDLETLLAEHGFDDLATKPPSDASASEILARDHSTMSFPVTKPQLDLIVAALDLVKKKTRAATTGAALAIVAKAYLDGKKGKG